MLALPAVCLVSGLAAAQTVPDSVVEPVVSTYAGNGTTGFGGDGGDRRKASMVFPVALAWNHEGNLLYLDMGRDLGGRIRKIDSATGTIDTVAGGGVQVADGVPARQAALPAVPWGLAVDSVGNVFVGSEGEGIVSRIDVNTGVITRFAGGGESLGDKVEPTLARLWKPMSVRVDRDDNVYIADGGLHAIFKVDTASGLMHLVAGTPGRAGFEGDGKLATNALLNWPTDLAIDEVGNMYIADRNNHVIRHIQAGTGTISTYSGAPDSPGFAGDGADRKEAQFRYPHNLLLDGSSLLIADLLNHRVRRIELASGTVETVAGSGNATYLGENVIASEAGLFEPAYLLKHPAGGLLVAAERSRRIFLIGDPVELPVPWWRQWWAIVSYSAALILFTVGIVRLRTRTLRVRLAELEASVSSRLLQLEEQKSLVEQQTAQLAELISMKDQLMARISHEFRTPLTVILGPIERLLENATIEPIRAYLKVTKRNAGRLLRLVDQLLDLARLRSGQPAPIAPTAAGPILIRIAASFESLAANQGIRIELGSIEDCILQASNEAVEMIAVNLISNALKFTPSGGLVKISLEKVRGMGELVVADNGIGISQDRLATIFKPLEVSSVADNTGAGLGLALVWQAANSYGGEVDVQSRRGLGSTFRVVWPLSQPGAFSPPPDREPTVSNDAWLELSPLRKPIEVAAAAVENEIDYGTILVIEDNADMRDYLRQLISPHYTIAAAADGNQGIEMVAEIMPDLVVCDVMLPERDGYDVCLTLKNNDLTSHIPVILLTALQDRKDKLRGLEERADDFLTKPFNEAELLLRIANLLEVRTLLRRRYARKLRLDMAQPADMRQSDQMYLEKLERACSEQHIDSTLGIKQLAAALAVSERQLQRKTKALLGLTPIEYLREYRLRSAHERLTAGDLVSDTAIAVGFGSHAYFSTCFKARFGYTPDTVRNKTLANI